jgi:hypothetical protein
VTVRAGLLLLSAVACSSPPPAEPTVRAPAPPVSNARAVVRACVEVEPAAAPGHPAPPEAAGAAAPAGAGLAKEDIRRLIRSRLPEVRRCYEAELVNRPSLTGKTTAHFTIAPDGSVTRISADGFDPAVDACVAGVLSSLRFPRPAGGGVVHVNYPFVFQHSGTDADRPAGVVAAVATATCRVAEPPRALLDREEDLHRCARELPAGAAPIDLEVVLRRGAAVTGPEPARACVARALAAIVDVDPPASCTVALGDPRTMGLQKPAVGAEVDCPAELR